MGNVYRQLQITNETKHLSQVRRVIAEVMEESPFSREERSKIILAVDEALANVIEHAYEGGTGIIEIVVELDEKQFAVILRDNGTVFDPGSIPEPDLGRYVALGKKGGFGMFLMRKIMDDVRYEFGPVFNNQLTMVKFCS